MHYYIDLLFALLYFIALLNFTLLSASVTDASKDIVTWCHICWCYSEADAIIFIFISPYGSKQQKEKKQKRKKKLN